MNIKNTITENQSNLDKKIEKFDTTDVIDSCHFVCQNLSTINILLIIILIILGYMFLQSTIK
jgi:hypothetical protein